MAVGTRTMRPSQTKLKVWGTSRAVRIPKRFCESLGISEESVLIMEQDVDERGPFIRLRPESSEHRSFADAPLQSMDILFEGYEGEYEPAEAAWGDDVGSEVVA